MQKSTFFLHSNLSQISIRLSEGLHIVDKIRWIFCWPTLKSFAYAGSKFPALAVVAIIMGAAILVLYILMGSSLFFFYRRVRAMRLVSLQYTL